MFINKLLEFVENVGHHIQFHGKEDKERHLHIVLVVNRKRKSDVKKGQIQENIDKLLESESKETQFTDQLKCNSCLKWNKL